MSRRLRQLRPWIKTRQALEDRSHVTHQAVRPRRNHRRRPRLCDGVFADLGLEVEGRTFGEGEFIDTVIGIPDSRTEIVMLRPPDGRAGVELASFVRPHHEPGSPTAMANELGLRSICFEVDDLQAAVDGLAANGYGLVGGIGQHENTWRMAHVRGPEGIVVSRTERID